MEILHGASWKTRPKSPNIYLLSSVFITICRLLILFTSRYCTFTSQEKLSKVFIAFTLSFNCYFNHCTSPNSKPKFWCSFKIIKVQWIFMFRDALRETKNGTDLGYNFMMGSMDVNCVSGLFKYQNHPQLYIAWICITKAVWYKEAFWWQRRLFESKWQFQIVLKSAVVGTYHSLSIRLREVLDSLVSLLGWHLKCFSALLSTNKILKCLSIFQREDENTKYPEVWGIHIQTTKF